MKQRIHRILSLSCAAALVISLAGCSGSESAATEQNSTGTDQVTAGADQSATGADQNIAGADQNTQGADQNTQGADQNTQGADQNTQGADQNTQGADQNTQDISYDGQTLTVQVTAVNGSTITANPGESQQGFPGGAGGSNSTTPPAAPSGDAGSSDSTTPPAAPSGDAGGPDSPTFVVSGDPVTFEISDETTIAAQDGSSASISDIAVNSILQVSIGDSGEVTAVIIIK